MTVWHETSFCALIFRWRGSIWRVVWKELFIFYTVYFTISFLYRFAMYEDSQIMFNKIVVEFNDYLKLFPITYLLGFYVTSMVGRYWHQFQSLAWPDDMCCWANFIIPGKDYDSRIKRRTLARYFVLTCVLAWRDVSSRVRKRFPKIMHIVQSGLMTEREQAIYERNKISSIHWMIPIDWCQRIIEEMLYEENTLAAPMASHVMNQINVYRSKFRLLYSFNWLSVPLTYTQCAAIATYSYFLFCIIGRQFIDPRYNVPGFEIDFYIPVFTTLQFIFYVGWLKVGQYIMHPFGEDDDDFELNAILDRHIKVAMAIVDGDHKDRPPMVEDIFMTMPQPKLPHTKASSKIVEQMPKIATLETIRKKDTLLVINDKNKMATSSVIDALGKMEAGDGESTDSKKKRRRPAGGTDAVSTLISHANTAAIPLVRTFRDRLPRPTREEDIERLSVHSLAI